MKEQKDSRLTQADIDQDQAGYFDLFRSSHLSLPSHNGKTLEDCPVCKTWFIPSPNLNGKPLESYRMVFIDNSEYNGEPNIQYVEQKKP